jgi:hypothetical protein
VQVEHVGVGVIEDVVKVKHPMTTGSGNLNHGITRGAVRLGHGFAVLRESFEMKLDRLAHFVFALLARGAHGGDTGNIRAVRRVVRGTVALDDDQIAMSQGFSIPACLKMLASVLG